MRPLHIHLFIKTLLLTLLLFSKVTYANTPYQKTPLQYTIILDLSDRVLVKQQVAKDIALIEAAFKQFEKKARLPFILTSKDQFSVKIIPQKGSPLDINFFENKLQINLNEISIKEKNNKLKAFATSLRSTLEALSKACKYSNKTSDYAGVDIWSYLNTNGAYLKKKGYTNTVLLLTDGYFDFESSNHVLKAKNRSTSTRFFKNLTGLDWKTKAKNKDYGLLPIQLDPEVTWIVSGIQSKNERDILQTKKITYFWSKWLKESGVAHYNFILNTSTKDMTSRLLTLL